MNGEELIRHFERAAEAPGGVAKLRQTILDLAVRGKLVPQDPSDEPVCELLKRILTEKQRLVDEGVIRKPKPLPPVDKDEVPFSLPAGWAWARVADVVSIDSNLVDPSDYPNYPHIAPDNIESGTGRLLPYRTVHESQVKSPKHLFYPNHLLYSKIRPNLAKIVLVDFEGLCSADMYPIQSFISKPYTHFYFLSSLFVEQSVQDANRVAMPKINQDALSKILIAVPPLAEQERIVSRINELIHICHRLAAAQTHREKARERMTQSAFWSLTSAIDHAQEAPNQFGEAARFVVSNVEPLTARPQQIAQWRQAILDLAVRGKLVPQDPSDEPASELLKRIQAEKQRLVDEGVIRKPKPLPAVDEDNVPFPLPAGWIWTRIRNATTDRGQKRPDSEFSYIDVSCIDKGHGVILSPEVMDPHSAPSRARKIVEKGDVLYSCVRPYLLNVAVVDRDFVPVPIASTAFAVIYGFDQILPHFIWMYLRSGLAIAQVESHMRGVAYPAINDGDFSQLLFPLAPLAEQQRIVSRASDLLRLCGKLESCLTLGEQRSEHLLEALIHHAMSLS